MSTLDELEALAAELAEGRVSRSEFDQRKALILKDESQREANSKPERSVPVPAKPRWVGQLIIAVACASVLLAAFLHWPELAGARRARPSASSSSAGSDTYNAATESPRVEQGRNQPVDGPSPADTRSPVDRRADEDPMVISYERLNDECRGGSGDDPQTITTCEQRQALGRKLDARGLCKGRDDEAGYQMQWHPCGPGSLRLDNENAY